MRVATSRAVNFFACAAAEFAATLASAKKRAIPARMLPLLMAEAILSGQIICCDENLWLLRRRGAGKADGALLRWQACRHGIMHAIVQHITLVERIPRG